MLLSEMISKPVLNLYSGKIEGTIKDVTYDKTYHKIKDFIMFDQDEEEFSIFGQKVMSFDKDVIVIKNNEAITLNSVSIPDENHSPLNKEVFTIDGKNLGKIIDCEISKDLKIDTFKTTNTEFKPKSIVQVSSSVIVNLEEKKVCLSSFKPKIKKQPTVIPLTVKTMPIISNDEKEIKEDKEIFKISNAPTPQKLIGNGNFLLGRKATKTIYGLNNEILIKKESIITENILEKIKKHNKLAELTLFSKQKI